MSIETGGQAFPRTAHFHSTAVGYDNDAQEGMTLRDYFAAKAMQGFCAAPGISYSPSDYAETAYQIADAMLAARQA